jgi:hypothetical protein
MIDVKSTLEIIETKLAKKGGNDIVDLAQEQLETTGYLDKIFTQNERY